MIREVCLFDKFSFCKNGVRCLRIHLKEVCWNRECRDNRKCNKRHPKPSKSFMEKGFCRFGTSCRYSHRPPKVIEEQNKKIESLENNTCLLITFCPGYRAFFSTDQSFLLSKPRQNKSHLYGTVWLISSHYIPSHG